MGILLTVILEIAISETDDSGTTHKTNTIITKYQPRREERLSETGQDHREMKIKLNSLFSYYAEVCQLGITVMNIIF